MVRFLCLLALVVLAGLTAAPAAGEGPLVVLVMDPLAAPLSCPCVKGYAQRDYRKLASYLERELDRPVKIFFNESLVTVLEQKTSGRADIVIGIAQVLSKILLKAGVESDRHRLHRFAQPESEEVG